MSGKGTRIAIVALVAFGLLCSVIQAAERLKGMVQEVDKTGSTMTLMVEEGKTVQLRSHPVYLEDLEKGKQIEVLVEDGMVIAVDKAGGGGD